MKLKLFLLATFLVIFSGCISSSVVHRAKTNFRQTAAFFPSAVYENPEDGLIAIEGTRSWTSLREDGDLVYVLLPRSDYDAYIAGRISPETRFLIKYSEEKGTTPIIKESLPVGFSLVEDHLGMRHAPGGVASISRNRPSALVELTILPATLVLDAVTLPVQLFIGVQIGSMGH